MAAERLPDTKSRDSGNSSLNKIKITIKQWSIRILCEQFGFLLSYCDIHRNFLAILIFILLFFRPLQSFKTYTIMYVHVLLSGAEEIVLYCSCMSACTCSITWHNTIHMHTYHLISGGFLSQSYLRAAVRGFPKSDHVRRSGDQIATLSIVCTPTKLLCTPKNFPSISITPGPVKVCRKI